MPESRGAFTFEEVLPRLVGLYEAGRLVPFIGAGMSMPNCRGWEPLILGLEAAAKAGDERDHAGAVDATVGTDEKTKAPAEALIRRADAATRRLKSGKPGQFETALASALFDTRYAGQVPPQTTALAAIWWPLVLTTNYDNFFVEAVSVRFDPGGLRVVGRGPEDCQRVLTSLSTAGRAVLWALQGHLAKPCEPRGTHQEDARLAREIVLDYSEYRRVTHREPHFRRAFAEVFRQRSLFFLGAGIAEPYFQELFGEILEFYGPGTRTHYALIPEGQVDPRFMYSRFQIAVIEYKAADSYGEVPRRLYQLAGELDRRSSVATAWSWGSASIERETNGGGAIPSNTQALEVRCGALPRAAREGECLAVSAGGRPSQPTFYLSGGIYETIGGWGVPIDTTLLASRSDSGIATSPALCDGKYIGEYVDRDVYAVRARNEKDEKDLSLVRPASLALFDVVKGRYGRIHMQLLASGGTGNDSATWSRRPFPARFTFTEIVRAWGEWKRRNPADRACLTLHITDPEVCREIGSGRIDVSELLLAEDVRFWAEIVERDGSLERRLFHKLPTATLAELVGELGLSSEYWKFDVSPPASIENPQSPEAPVGTCLDRTLRDLRLVPGGTLHFHRL
jgi:hypothetical protein